jgi:hypothetical protein
MIQGAQQQGVLSAQSVENGIYEPVLCQMRSRLQAAPKLRMRAQCPGHDESRRAGEIGQGEKTKTGHDT